jgi:hypothetical protein
MHFFKQIISRREVIGNPSTASPWNLIRFRATMLPLALLTALYTVP